MRTFLKGTLIGTVAAALAVFAVALSLSILADASNWSSFQLAVGPLHLLDFERTSHHTATTFGPGLALLCLIVGALNGAAAILISRSRHATA